MPNLNDNLLQKELSFDSQERLSTISVEKLLGYKKNNQVLREPQNFFIPSYQRGYRWETNQITDLIKDIKEFVNNTKDGNVYWLQPIILKPKEWDVEVDEGKKRIKGWEVVDGQQRLTSLFIMIQYFLKNDENKNYKYSFIPYNIYYETRPKLDFNNIDTFDKTNSIEEYYIKNAWDTLQEFMPEVDSEKYNCMKTTLMNPDRMDNSKFLAFITYRFDENIDDDSTIDKFNTINGGKIKLTNAELIKALFILYIQDYTDDCKEAEYKKIKFTQEWDTIETELENEDFWNFIANKSYTPDTRMNIIFDFIASQYPNNYKNDPEKSYKIMQDLSSNQQDVNSILDKINIFLNKSDSEFSFLDIWDYAKKIFQLFKYWYEDRTLYHLIGYLITVGVTIEEIYKNTLGLGKSKLEKKLRVMITGNLFNKESNKENLSNNLEQLNYENDHKTIRKVLLLFNILQYTKKTNNRFSFRFFKEESWDIEHINPRTENNISTLSDQYVWLSNIHPNDIDNDDIFNEITAMKEDVYLKLNSKDTKRSDTNFSDLYNKVCEIREDHKEKDDYKDGLANLTLLNSSINQAYHNSIFPTKRRFIVQADMLGTFIPIETKNVFLKYYSEDDTNNNQWKFCWNVEDRKAYFKKILRDISILYSETEDE